MLTRPFIFLSLAIVGAVSPVVSAEDISPPKEAVFEVRLNVAAVQDTEIGSRLIRAVKQMAAEEIGDDRDSEKAFESFEEALGFDPVEEVRSIRLFGSSFENPEQGIQAVIEMKNTTGNLEGLMLALPGYDSSDYGKHVIHSVAPDDDFRAFGAIHGTREKQIVIATSKDRVEEMLDSLDDVRSSSPSDRDRDGDRDGASLVAVRLLQFPKLDDLEGPPEAILKMVRAASLQIREYGEDLEVEVAVEADTEKHAEQMHQLAKGAAAMVALASESEEDEEELQMVARVLETLDAEHDGESVNIRVKLPQELVLEFLREEADLPIDR